MHLHTAHAGKQISLFIKKGDVRNGAVFVYCLTDELAMDRAFGKAVPVVEVGFNFSRQGVFPQAVHSPQNGKLQSAINSSHVCFPQGAGPVHSIRSGKDCRGGIVRDAFERPNDLKIRPVEKLTLIDFRKIPGPGAELMI